MLKLNLKEINSKSKIYTNFITLYQDRLNNSNKCCQWRKFIRTSKCSKKAQCWFKCSKFCAVLGVFAAKSSCLWLYKRQQSSNAIFKYKNYLKGNAVFLKSYKDEVEKTGRKTDWLLEIMMS